VQVEKKKEEREELIKAVIKLWEEDKRVHSSTLADGVSIVCIAVHSQMVCP
jgi:hypothetical protein